MNSDLPGWVGGGAGMPQGRRRRSTGGGAWTRGLLGRGRDRAARPGRHWPRDRLSRALVPSQQQGSCRARPAPAGAEL